jgi:hypothetical protein
MKKQKLPKKAKLITDGGFYMIIPNPEFRPAIHVPLMKKIRVASPETGDINMELSLDITFGFVRTFGGYAEYRQMGVVSIVK